MPKTKPLIQKWEKSPFDSIKSNSEIFLSFFEDYKDTIDIMNDMIKQNIYHRGKNSSSKVFPIINICKNFWQGKCLDNGFKDKNREIKTKLGKRSDVYQGYRTNLNLFFKEFERIHKMGIPSETKKFIELCFEIPGMRKGLIELSKEQDIFMAFEAVVKDILYFIMKETHKFKDKVPDEFFKRERLLSKVLPIMKEKIQNFLFSKSKSDNQIRQEIITKLEEIFKNDKIEDSDSRLKMPIYIFHECDSDNSDILISLIKLFSDDLTKMILTKNMGNQVREISESLTKLYQDSEYIDNFLIQEEISFTFRRFIFQHFEKNPLLHRPDDERIKEIIIELRKITDKDFENIKKNYLKWKVDCLFKEVDSLLNREGKIKYFLENMYDEKIKEDHPLFPLFKSETYPLTKEEYEKRCSNFFKVVKRSDIIKDLRKTITK
jgi:hypothetical protein